LSENAGQVTENLNTDKGIIIQVEQLDKEKKVLNAKSKVMAKRTVQCYAGVSEG
jgi:hypothetical protein